MTFTDTRVLGRARYDITIVMPDRTIDELLALAGTFGPRVPLRLASALLALTTLDDPTEGGEPAPFTDGIAVAAIRLGRCLIDLVTARKSFGYGLVAEALRRAESYLILWALAGGADRAEVVRAVYGLAEGARCTGHYPGVRKAVTALGVTLPDGRGQPTVTVPAAHMPLAIPRPAGVLIVIDSTIPQEGTE